MSPATRRCKTDLKMCDVVNGTKAEAELPDSEKPGQLFVVSGHVHC